MTQRKGIAMLSEILWSLLAVYILIIVILAFTGRVSVYRDNADAALTATMIVLLFVAVYIGRLITPALPAFTVLLWVMFAIMALVSVYNVIQINNGFLKGMLVLPAKLVLSAAIAGLAFIACSTIAAALKNQDGKKNSTEKITTVALNGGILAGVLWFVSRMMPLRPLESDS